jgi:hypothetical protein
MQKTPGAFHRSRHKVITYRSGAEKMVYGRPSNCAMCVCTVPSQFGAAHFRSDAIAEMFAESARDGANTSMRVMYTTSWST